MEFKLSDQVLAIDIGGGTQDILVWDRQGLPENSYKMVMPSPTRLVARQILTHTRRREDICLTGYTMGGGASTQAIVQHLDSGLRLYALPEAALTIHDNLDRVRSMGVKIVDVPPTHVPQVKLQDVDMAKLRAGFGAFGVDIPSAVAVAVQDHGFSPHESNRLVRFRYWREFLESGGRIQEWALRDPPAYMTRMLAVRKSVPDALVLDTGAAAIIGAMLDPIAQRWIEEGLTIVNLGNFHTVAALVAEDRVYGVYEHHTGLLTNETLLKDLRAFQQGRLTNEEVFRADGHGCTYADRLPDKSFENVLVTGPRRRDFVIGGAHAASPFGDMMLTGCFGLVKAFCWLAGLDWP